MAALTRCPHCQTPHRVSGGASGSSVRCNRCRRVFRLANEDEPEETPGLPTAQLVETAGHLQTRIDLGPDAPEPAPDLLPRRLRKASVRINPMRKYLVGAGLAVAAVLCLGAGFAAARLWLIPASKGSPTPSTSPDKEGVDGAQQQAEQFPAIKPPPLEKDRVVRPLPSVVGDLAVGGAGRYLILHLPAQRKLAVFDANEGKVTRYLSVAADNVKFAAGLDKLMVALPDNNLIQRWDLRTGEREVSAPLPFAGVVKALAMGSASQGPLLVHWAVGTGALDRAPVDFLDIQTLKPLPIQGNAGRGHCYRDFMHFRASAAGTVFGVWCTSHSPQGIGALVFEGRTLHSYYEHNSALFVIPGPDGRVLHTGAGLYTNQVKRLEANATERCVPAHHGGYHLRFRPGDPLAGRFGRPQGQPVPQGVTLYMAGNDRPLLTVPDVEVPSGNDHWARNDFTSDKRLHLIPAAKLLVTIPETNDKLVLHRFDLDAALDKAGIDFLFVTSQPPPRAKRGDWFNYRIAVKSKKGGVKYKLETGPDGMHVSDAGLVRWKVPAAEPAEADVIIGISDRSGQEVFHTFKVRLEN